MLAWTMGVRSHIFIYDRNNCSFHIVDKCILKYCEQKTLSAIIDFIGRIGRIRHKETDRNRTGLTSRFFCPKQRTHLTAVGFEPTPLRTGALSQCLTPLGQTVDDRRKKKVGMAAKAASHIRGSRPCPGLG